MAKRKCSTCPIMCGYNYPTAIIGPLKDNPTPVPGSTPEGQETQDIRAYCEDNYIPKQ